MQSVYSTATTDWYDDFGINAFRSTWPYLIVKVLQISWTICLHNCDQLHLHLSHNKCLLQRRSTRCQHTNYHDTTNDSEFLQTTKTASVMWCTHRSLTRTKIEWYIWLTRVYIKGGFFVQTFFHVLFFLFLMFFFIFLSVFFVIFLSIECYSWQHYYFIRSNYSKIE